MPRRLLASQLPKHLNDREGREKLPSATMATTYDRYQIHCQICNVEVYTCCHQGGSGIEKKDPGSIFLLRPVLLD